MAEQVYVATQSGSSEIDGDTVVFIKGVTTVSEGHPLLKAVPDYFQPIEAGANYGTTTIKHTATDEEIQAAADAEAAETTEEGIPEETTEDESQGSETTTVEPPEEINASKEAIALAAEHGIDITTLEGTGHGDAVLKADVEKAIAQKEAEGN
jgi:pyruvate/2-oxoglutarate dehydrogenase complex dihydrolipoamide acyltransferase (E2) component